MDKKVAMIAGAAIGVGLMYFADPRMGRRRRALVGDQLVRARRTLNRSALITSRGLTNRARGLMAEMRACLRSGEVSDEVLEARVRAELGFLVSHPSAIEVTTEYGHVTLSGPLLASEVKQVLKGVFSVRGVTSVDNQIERHKEPWNVPADGHGPAVRRLRQPARCSPTSLGGPRQPRPGRIQVRAGLAEPDQWCVLRIALPRLGLRHGGTLHADDDTRQLTSPLQPFHGAAPDQRLAAMLGHQGRRFRTILLPPRRSPQLQTSHGVGRHRSILRWPGTPPCMASLRPVETASGRSWKAERAEPWAPTMLLQRLDHDQGASG
jgi:BON domain